MDPVKRIEQSTAFAGEKVKAVTKDDLGKPTPCTEFDVRGLLNHMIGGLAMLKAAAEGSEAKMPEGEQFGDDPGADYQTRRAALLDALRGEGVLERGWKMPFGELPGQMMASIAFMEHVAHGWDLAKATSQDTSIPDGLATEALDVVTPMDQMLRMPGVCGPAVSVSDDASTGDKFVAFMGRQP
jgi:uncharacterized protein (TIGR03086 family)